MELKIKNKENELLDVLIEGKQDSDTTIIFVHGFAVDKHETASYFDDVALSLKNNYRLVRFDFSGCGKSEGNLVEKNYQKWADDLSVIIDYVKKDYPGKIYIFSQSMGCFITSLLSPDGIEKTIFTGLPNSNTEFLIERLVKRFGAREGAKIDTSGVSIFPRSSGKNQLIGSSFWQVLRSLQPVKLVDEFSKKTKLFLIYGKNDEILENKFLEEYFSIDSLSYKTVPGNHSFNNSQDRNNLIEIVKKFYENH